ncbi:MAG: ribosome small subunit-dependent GTPase A [Clostridia bacterium]|nr:ribosome small subunit-dependent GTPase A [Clostridia bacterium]
MREGILVRGRGGFYTVREEDGKEFVLRAKKKFRRLGLTPLVGDRVLFTPGEIEDADGWIEEILPRASQCLRPPVANVTLLCIVISPSPAPDWLLVDKLLIYARKQGLKALLILNKMDMPEGEGIAEAAQEMYRGAEAELIPVSALDESGLKPLKERLENEICCFSGQSGVGKSTLLNALFGLDQETGDISRRIRRGKNTTRHAELFIFGSIRVIDTPGFSLLEMDEAFDPVLLREYYPEFTPYEGRCRFSPCYHGKEPGCAVTQAAAEGTIDKRRLERYRQLLEDCRKAWRERYD